MYMCQSSYNKDWGSILHFLKTGQECDLFEHIHNDKDIEELTAAIIRGSTEACRYATRYDELTENHLLNALFALLYHYLPCEYQKLSNIMRMLIAGERETASSSLEDFVCRITGDTPTSLLDAIFAEVEKLEPGSFASAQYEIFRLAAGRGRNSYFISCIIRLQTIAPTLKNM